MAADYARFPLDGREWDEFWYQSRLEECRSDLEREFFKSQELVRSEVIQRLPDDQLQSLDQKRLSDYCRLAIAARYHEDGQRDEAMALVEAVLHGKQNHPLIDYPQVFRDAIAVRRSRNDFAAAIGLQRDFVTYVSTQQGEAAARAQAMDLAQLMVESGDESRGADIFQEWFSEDPKALAASNRELISSIRPEMLADTARDIQRMFAEARLEGDQGKLELFRELMDTPPNS